MEPIFKTSGFFNLPVSTYSPTFGVSALNEVQPVQRAVTQPEENQEEKKEVKPVEKKTEVKKEEKTEEKKETQLEELKEYFFETSSPVELNPVWGATRSALGLAVDQADNNEVSNIAKYSATLIQSDDPSKIFNFISKRLTSMPPNVGNPIYYLNKQLTFELAKKMKGGKK